MVNKQQEIEVIRQRDLAMTKENHSNISLLVEVQPLPMSSPASECLANNY